MESNLNLILVFKMIYRILRRGKKSFISIYKFVFWIFQFKISEYVEKKNMSELLLKKKRSLTITKLHIHK